MGKEQRRDFVIGGEHIAYLHAEHLQNGIARRNHLHFGKLRIDVGKLGPRLGHAHFSGRQIFVLRFGRAVRALGIIGGDHFALEQILLPLRVVAQELQLRILCIGVVNCGINLRFGKIAARM